MRRNELIVGLAKVLLVLSTPNGSATLKLAKSALDRGKPVLTPEHPMNKELLASRALPATPENILAVLG
jgi:predicted Rossmann fold nucleotide-binding protein DprA/Smf involved in DNA uptake